MVSVFQQLIGRPKVEQWVDKVVSMASMSVVRKEQQSKAVRVDEEGLVNGS